MVNVEDLIGQLRQLAERRYKVILLQGPPRTGKSALLRNASDQLVELRYIDYLKDVLNGPTPPALGAFGPAEFLDWIDNESQDTGLLIDEGDPLFSTWAEGQRTVFWSSFLRLEVRHPVVLATRFIEIEPPRLGHGTGRILRIS